MICNERIVFNNWNGKQCKTENGVKIKINKNKHVFDQHPLNYRSN